MATRRKSPGIAVSDLSDALQILPIRKAVDRMDRRSLPAERALMREFEKYRPSEAAAALGISYQKFGALKRGIEKGSYASPVLTDYLRAGASRIAEVPVLRREEFTAEIPHKGKRVLEVDEWITPEAFRKRELPWTRDIKPGGFASKRSALNWLGNVGGAAEYFFVTVKKTRDERLRYHVFDIRTRSELARKGNLKKPPKGLGILEAATHERITRSHRSGAGSRRKVATRTRHKSSRS